MVLRIYICGAHSTGKTTLLHDVIPHLKNIHVVEEVARKIIERNGWSRNDFQPSKNPEMFRRLNTEIIEEQMRIDEHNTSQNIDFISDRGLEPLVYCEYYINSEAKRELLELPGLRTWLNRLKRSLLFVVSPHVECLSEDGVRLQSSISELRSFTELLVRELDKHQIPFILIDNLNRQERINLVLDYIKSFDDTKKCIR
ncbi:uncharacterized protein LOC141907185 [Tubulanus polymorphus]|uniref:uncharacterized protein LOC141907185 n=1 Tax=Tubulanus polymorphus TaxID=672921 RepID=UPI003DA3A685